MKIRLTLTAYEPNSNQTRDYAIWTDEEGNVPMGTDLNLQAQELIDELNNQ